MKRRGKVLRDGSTGSGLLIVDGQQYPFSLKEMWRSETLPKPGMVVEVEFEQYGKILAIRALDDTEAAPAPQTPVSLSKPKGLSLASQAAARFGSINLIAAGLLLLSWTAMPAISFQTSLGKLDFTFWQMLEFLNSGNSFEAIAQSRNQADAGFYGFLALVAIAAPLLRFLWKNERIVWVGLLPMAFMIFVGLTIRGHVANAFSAGAQNVLNPVMQQMHDELLASISIGSGAYVSGLTCLYFAASAVRGLLSTKTTEKTPKENVRPAAA